jgi:hypothetical protein
LTNQEGADLKHILFETHNGGFGVKGRGGR